MDVINRRSESGLNPDAPMYVPWAYRTVEDFSDAWWDLVRSSPWFRDYWLSECFHDPIVGSDDDDGCGSFLPDDLFDDDLDRPREEEKVRERELVTMGALKWKGSRVLAEQVRGVREKVPPKIVNAVRVNPRVIQQPR
ncbi:Polyadenylate-binding protein-interacting protein 2 [Acorus calamus]|uniref:Polyadenylate-binding protein-interacting protein 2 n=1 Tax=Acorus calamus TaxID=4465 RepID=A0AAV9EJC2_ACOCL|nr:Polyadenylate-binding protein-interacting protein 2 [Acorus calamus]